MVKVNDVEVPEGLQYTKDHEWVRMEGKKARIGVTDFAQKQLREIVYVELPSEGETLTQNEPYGTVESVKAVSDLVAPISGTIDEVNTDVQNSPETLNEDPYDKGWLLLETPSNMADLETLMNHQQAVEWQMIGQGLPGWKGSGHGKSGVHFQQLHLCI